MPDGSEATTNYFNSRFRESNGETVELPEEALAVCMEYGLWRTLMPVRCVNSLRTIGSKSVPKCAYDKAYQMVMAA